MSLIFGIINLNDALVSEHEFNTLAQAVCNKESCVISQNAVNMMVGYGHYPGRNARVGIYDDGRLVVIADLRLFNIQELHAHISFSTPIEALAQAFRKWGTDCGNHLNGEYAAVFYDREQGTAFLLRDHIGTRPLTYCLVHHRLFFSSDEFGLMRSGLIPTKLNEGKLISNFFQFKGWYDKTMFENVHKVQTGCIYSISKEQQRIYRWWRPECLRKDNSLTYEAAVQKLRKCLLKATISRMENVRIGLHVSGGIDSCGVASIVADNTLDKSTLRAYSWSPEQVSERIDGVNELPFIEAFVKEKTVVVQYLTAEKIEVTQNAIIPEFETQHIERPVMQQAAKDGVELVFSGWGGDEAVSVSMRGVFNHLFFSLNWGKLFQYIKKTGIKAAIHKFKSEILPYLIPGYIIHTYRSEYTDWSKLRLFHLCFIFKHISMFLFHKRMGIYGRGNRSSITLNLLNSGHLSERMDSWAINAETFGFAYTYPLLDKEVLECFLQIPAVYTYADFVPRKLYRDAMKGIMPESIRMRMDKSEAIRMSYSFKLRQEGKAYLVDLFNALTPEEHLPFCNLKNWEKLIRKPLTEGISKKNFQEVTKLCFYLRYVGLMKKYITDQHLTKSR
ncbi:MAG: asparagine synthase-related protein [Bacteroidales bacterium]|nr:asparagine synthase-related protein [Bacteroidales bacterium]